MALTDHDGKLVKFSIHTGNAAESPVLPELLDGVEADELLADRAYDVNALRKLLASKGIVATIPPSRARKIPYGYDEDSYKGRHLVENLFADLKQFRGLATRYCKLASRFTSFIQLAWWCISSARTVREPGTGRPRSRGRKSSGSTPAVPVWSTDPGQQLLL